MPRRHRRAPEAGLPPAAVTTLGQRRERWQATDYEVRTVLGSTERVFRCPGCDQEIRNVTHVVAWPTHDVDASDRRHWHGTCWAARERRTPGVERGRSAPRY